MDLGRELLFGVAAPGLISVIGLLAARAVRMRLGTWALRAGWDGAVLAFACLAAHLALIGSPDLAAVFGLAPRLGSGLDLLPLAIGALALAALVLADGPDVRWWRWPLLVVVLAAAIGGPLFRLEWLGRAERLGTSVGAEAPRFVLGALGLGLVATLLLAGHEAVARRLPPLSWALVWLVVAGVAALACVQHSTASLALLIGAVAAGIGGLAVAAVGLGELRWAGLTLVALGLIAALGTYAATSGEDASLGIAIALLLISPLLAGLGAWCARTPFLQGLIAVSVVAGTAAAVFWWQWPDAAGTYS